MASSQVSTLFAALLRELAPYKGATVVIKVGGNSIDEDPAFLPSLAAQVSFLRDNGVRPVLVHGGGPQIDRALLNKGFSRDKAPDGRRPTSPEMMDTVFHVLALLSEDMGRALASCGSPVFVAARNDLCFIKAKPLHEGASLERDRTGIPEAVDARAIEAILDGREIVVLNSLGRDADGHDYNINADDCAEAVAVALRAKRLILATNVDGVLNRSRILIPRISRREALDLIDERIITGGMIPKIQGALQALQKGVGGVAIINAHRKGALLAELLSPAGMGTLIKEF